MRSRIKKHKPKDESLNAAAYVLSIKLPLHLVKVIDEVAQAQHRTRASLIRQTLADRFDQVA